MFKAFAQFVLSLALSAGLAAGVSPDVRDRLAHAWDKVDAVTTHVADLATQTGKDLVESVSGQTTIAASADTSASISAGTQSSGDTDEDTSLEESGEQTDINGSAAANVQAGGSAQSTIEGESSLNILFNGSTGGK